MAAYAAVVSLMNTMEHTQNHPFHSFSFDKTDIESIRPDLVFLLDFLESNSHGGSKEAEALESQIASAACEAEDVIDSHVVDEIHAGYSLDGGTCHFADLKKVIESMNSLKKMVMKVKAEEGFEDDQPRAYSTSAGSSRSPLTAMVGFDDELIQLMDLLTAQQSSRQLISIIGMGGMGKTTLAKNVYENSLIMQHFDIRVWATISQEYSMRKILLELLSCQGISTSDIDKRTEDELGELLNKSLWGRRYLIILDDIRSVEAWDSLNVFFPDNHNESRIVVTSRQSDVANHLGSSCLAMNFLDEEKSWNLFCQKVFSEQGCPPELEETGKLIVKKCNGLPLLIVVIGGHLGKSSRTEKYWERVASDMTSILDSGEDGQCLDVLYLSYSYLPGHLKPCFLYMGTFPEDREISVPTLVRLWVAEGFLKPSNTLSLEEVAEGCLKDLIDRNLILVRKCSWSGKMKTCHVHGLLRELCLKVATKEKFFHVVNDTPQPLDTERRLVIHRSIPLERVHAMESAPLTRSLICEGGQSPFDYRLLKVLKGVDGVADEDDASFLELKFEQVNLRYFDCKIRSLLTPPMYIQSSVSLLWNLQTLIISHYADIFAPVEIWKMPQLRHVEVRDVFLSDPPPDDLLVLQNLQTLLEVRNFRMSEDVCKRIPNIKKLHVKYDNSLWEWEATSYYSPQNLGCFQKLESLRCTFPDDYAWRNVFLGFTFPISLRKLRLENCYLDWEDLSIIGLLPHLEVLKLGSDAVSAGQLQWSPVAGEFLRLKFMEISVGTDLVFWIAESWHFPVLEKLVVEHFNKLHEIPSGIGEIPTLGFIGLKNCCEAVATSAMRILVEQERLGNEGLQLVVEFWDEDEYDDFREILQEEGLSSNNLRLILDDYDF